ncbi:MAG TPA: hypothetical protein VF766_03640 [Pyrinomonadaceae bacterium]
MSATLAEQFLTSTAVERLRLVKDESNAAALQELLGLAAYADYRKLLGRLDEGHLSGKTAKNLIFVPGVMGSLLRSDSKGGIWWIDPRTRQHIDDLRLAPGGLEDADPNNAISAAAVDTSYEPFLTAILARDDFGHVGFPYDWRKPFNSSTEALKNLILQTYDSNGNCPVHLVAHSMGGLMVRATLMEHGDDLWPKLGRIVFIATPHYGSQAIGGYLKNHFWGFELMALLGLYLGRETFRSLWGVLSLLPAPRGIYPGTRPNDSHPWRSTDANNPYPHPCANFDMYKAENWKLGLTPQQTTELQQALSAVADFHRKMYDHHQNLSQILRDRMLVIAGVGFKTLFRLAYDTRFFGLWESMDKVFDRVEGDPHRDGDGRVPVASAALENVQVRYAKGVHAGLPNIPAVYNDVFNWLNEKTLSLLDDPVAANSSHLATGEDESEAPHLDGTSRRIPFTDDPGYWNLSQPTAETLKALDASLGLGLKPEFINVRLF